jgi:hypothetical protein
MNGLWKTSGKDVAAALEFSLCCCRKVRANLTLVRVSTKKKGEEVEEECC